MGNDKLIPAIYGKLPSRKGIESDKVDLRKTARIAFLIYGSILSAFYLICFLWPDYASGAKVYYYAAIVLCAIFIWPFVVMYDAQYFYKVSNDIYDLFNNGEADAWYTNNANRTFRFFAEEQEGDKKKRKKYFSFGFVCNTFLIVALVVLYCFKLYEHINKGLLFAAVAVSGAVTGASSKHKNLNTTLCTVFCGMSYYVYLLYYSETKLPTLFSTDLLNDLLLIIGIAVFFIAGTAIYPMIGTLKAFYYSDLDTKLNIQEDKISQSLDKIQGIRRYFNFMVFISVIAFFQLLIIVYLVGVLNKESTLTILIFIFGSLFPLTMYCASGVLFNRFIHKLYLHNVEQIDSEIGKAYEEKLIDKLQALISLKGTVYNEYEGNGHIKYELIAALLSPVITVILAFVFPNAKV